MGLNTVAFLLNDFQHYLEKSPKTVAWALANPPLHPSREEKWYNDLCAFAEQNREDPLHPQCLRVLSSFHADCISYFRAGGNTIVDLKVVRYGKTKEGKRTVTLELPDWAKSL